MLLEADRVNQLEPGVKDLVALVQNISSMGVKPPLKAQPLRCTALVVGVSMSGTLFARVV